MTDLTQRERECLLAVWETGNGTDAALRLGIGRYTLKAHLQNARRKLGARTTLEAIRRLDKLVETKATDDGQGAIVAAAIVWTKAHSTSQVTAARRTLRATVDAYLGGLRLL